MSIGNRIAKGAIAGAVGTLALDLLNYAQHRASNGDESFTDWEITTDTPMSEAGAPAEFAEQVSDTVGIDIPEHAGGATTNIVHWLTGVGYGIAHGLFASRLPPVASGVTTGTAAFANSYGVLGAMGIYKPAWEYQPRTLARDLGGHLAYGLTTEATYRALDRNGS